MAKLDKGALESRVMGLMWDDAGWLSPREVRDRLAEEHDLAYTTVMTVLTRLWRKGRVDRKAAGRGYVYRAVGTRDEYAAARMQEMLASCDDPDAALASFVGQIDERGRQAVRRALRRER